MELIIRHEISVDIRTDLVNMVKQYYPDILVILTMRQLV
jgi:hypothetical protein